MFKNWTNRDWIWLTGALIFVIILLLANYYLEWKTDFSIIASATSIALAIMAIFLSLKQDSDSKYTSESMRQDLTTQIGSVISLLSSRTGVIEEAATNVEQTVDTNTETRNDSYTYEQLVEYGERIKQETIESFKIELNRNLLKEIESMDNNHKQTMDRFVRGKGIDLEDEVIKVIKMNPNFTMVDIISILENKGIRVPTPVLKELMKKYQK